jgi:glycine cleavage system H protein
MSTRYTRDHEWIRIDGATALIGISHYAQEQLGDIVFVELPDVGKVLEKGADIAVVESVKAASDIYAPVAGEVVEINPALADGPETVNSAAETEGWFVRLKVTNPADVEELMDGEAYKAFLATL